MYGKEQSRTGIIITHTKENCISFTRYFSTCGINHFVAKIAEWGPLSMTYTCNTPPLGLPCREGTLPLFILSSTHHFSPVQKLLLASLGHDNILTKLSQKQCPKLSMHPAPGVHMLRAGCTIFKDMHTFSAIYHYYILRGCI